MRNFLATSILLGLAITPHAGAQHVPGTNPIGLRGDASGTWYDPTRSGQGLTLHVIDGDRAIVAWYTFDHAGRPLWLTGLGVVEGDRVRAPISRAEGGAFPDVPNIAPDLQPWGEIVFDFEGCSRARLSWTADGTEFTPGSIELSRLAGVHGARCNSEEEFGEVREYAFESGMQGFEGFFFDLPADDLARFELQYRHESLPAPLDARRGLLLAGTNFTDDLGMFVRKRIDGLRADTVYAVELEIDLASNVGEDCFGIGGSPGGDVFLHLGASTDTPRAHPDESGMLRLAGIRGGQQSEAGVDTRVAGDLTTPQVCVLPVESGEWHMKTVSTNGQPLRARTDANGALWIAAGSESGYEGRSRWYLAAARVRLLEIVEADSAVGRGDADQ